MNWAAYAPDGRRVLSAGADQTVRLWNVESGAEQVRFFGHTASVTCVACSPNGRYAASGSYDRTVRVWRLPPLGSAMKPSRAAGGDRLFPGAGGEEGEKEWKLAEFYRRNGHPGSAYFYYQVLRRRYPASPHAKEATERMKELRRVLEKAVDETDQEPGATR